MLINQLRDVVEKAIERKCGLSFLIEGVNKPLRLSGVTGLVYGKSSSHELLIFHIVKGDTVIIDPYYVQAVYIEDPTQKAVQRSKIF